MNPNDQDTRITLLNEYAQCLERENSAKSIEIETLHQQLARMEGENGFLRAGLEEMRSALEMRERRRNSCSLQTSVTWQGGAGTGLPTADACCQTADEQEEQCLDQISQIFSLSQSLKEKDEIIARYHKECEEMFEAIEKLEEANQSLTERHGSDRELLNKLEQRLRKEQQRRLTAQQRLQDASYNIYSAGEEVQSHKQQAAKYEQQLQSLIIKNNGLIEHVRALEREKNEYYRELKRVSRVSFGAEEPPRSACKKSRKVSEQRFREIEQHLSRVRGQNMAIQSNLMIAR